MHLPAATEFRPFFAKPVPAESNVAMTWETTSDDIVIEGVCARHYNLSAQLPVLQPVWVKDEE